MKIRSNYPQLALIMDVYTVLKSRRQTFYDVLYPYKFIPKRKRMVIDPKAPHPHPHPRKGQFTHWKSERDFS